MPSFSLRIPPSPHATPRPRLLIVDDDQLMRTLHTLVLQGAGYDVDTAGDGAAALERLAEEKFDLVLTDRAMPTLDGASMVLALRSAGSSIPVVMVSASLAFSPLPPSVAREVSAALPKPARSGEVLAAVAHALRGTPRSDPMPSARPLPPIVRIVLIQATLHRLRGQITPEVFEAQIRRLSREELEPRGLTLSMSVVKGPATRCLIKTGTGEVHDIFEIPHS
jgi:CheY-like chemotaxis protein